jgi:hypothetical protein
VLAQIDLTWLARGFGWASHFVDATSQDVDLQVTIVTCRNVDDLGIVPGCVALSCKIDWFAYTSRGSRPSLVIFLLILEELKRENWGVYVTTQGDDLGMVPSVDLLSLQAAGLVYLSAGPKLSPVSLPSILAQMKTRNVDLHYVADDLGKVPSWDPLCPRFSGLYTPQETPDYGL